jgi:elongation factor Ts
MTQITAAQVNGLRKQTGAGMMDCKKALIETNGDADKAIDVLRKKGQKVAAKRADRDSLEGVVLSSISKDSTTGVMLSLNCETDFVAKNESFIALANSILLLAIEHKSESIQDIKELSFKSGMTVYDKLIEQTGVIGEKIELNNYSIINAPHVSNYIHNGNKLSTLVGLSMSTDDSSQIGQNIAMQIAAMNPLALNESDISKEVIDKEIEIGKDLAKKEGKPEEMLEKIALGRLKKFFKENTLLNQTYIQDSKKSVKQYLDDCNKDLDVVVFKRTSLV